MVLKDDSGMHNPLTSERRYAVSFTISGHWYEIYLLNMFLNNRILVWDVILIVNDVKQVSKKVSFLFWSDSDVICCVHEDDNIGELNLMQKKMKYDEIKLNSIYLWLFCVLKWFYLLQH